MKKGIEQPVIPEKINPVIGEEYWEEICHNMAEVLYVVPILEIQQLLTVLKN